MIKYIGIAAAFAAALAVQAAPVKLEQLRLRTTMQPASDQGLAGNSMFNPRFFDGKVYANQINTPCFGRYPVGSSTAEMLVNNSADNTLEHRMVAPFRGAFRNKYLIGSSSAAASTTSLVRYDYDGANPVLADAPDAMSVDAFDWVDDDTLIYAVYTSGNRKRLCLADVTAEPFSVTKNTAWNQDGFIVTSVTTRIRNVRKGDVYGGYAYYGDAGQNTNPNFYAIDLSTGAETVLGNAGTLTGSGSFGLWTVLERGGFLYVQTTDNGIKIYAMNNATSLGSLYAACSKEQLDAMTAGSAQYFGLDVTTDGQNWLLGGLAGKAFHLGPRFTPYLANELQVQTVIQPSKDLGIAGNSMFNPRIFEGKIYANQINVPCFGRYPQGSATAEMLVNNSGDNTLEHRMVAPFQGAFRTNYLLGSSSAAAATTALVRYDFDGANPVSASTPDGLSADAFDWVDDDTIVYAVYTSGNRKRLCLADVTADPFALTANTTWNPEGFVTTSVSTRIRNVRKGDLYSGYAYYGDAGQNANPAFYALNLSTGAETLLGNAGTLTGSGSFGIWTVLERDGYLYVQTTDNGVQVYNMANATTLGALHAVYTKEQLDAITGGAAQYFGLDATADGRRLLLGGLDGKVFELTGRPLLSFSRNGSAMTISWPASFSEATVQSSSSLSINGFSDMSPQPAVTEEGAMNKITIPIGSENRFFRLRK